MNVLVAVVVLISSLGVVYGAWRNLRTAEALRECVSDFRAVVTQYDRVVHRAVVVNAMFREDVDPKKVAQNIKAAMDRFDG